MSASEGLGIATKLGGFVVAVALLFTGAWALGATAGPDRSPDPVPVSAGTAAGGSHSGHGDDGGGGDASQAVAPSAPSAKGLAVSERGYTLETVATPPGADVPGEFAFRITGPTGAPVTAFTPPTTRRCT